MHRSWDRCPPTLSICPKKTSCGTQQAATLSLSLLRDVLVWNWPSPSLVAVGRRSASPFISLSLLLRGFPLCLSAFVAVSPIYLSLFPFHRSALYVIWDFCWTRRRFGWFMWKIMLSLCPFSISLEKSTDMQSVFLVLISLPFFFLIQFVPTVRFDCR